MKNILKNIGPGSLVAAAFIGPGTVTVCTLAGVNFGYQLLWVLLLATVATIVLQNMAAILGVVAQKSLSEVLVTELKNPRLKILVVGLILSAIVIGNASYEAGNISGGTLGLETVFGERNINIGAVTLNVYSLLIGLIAAILLYRGSYRVLENLFFVLVILMSLSFLITALITKPDILEVFKGVFFPTVPKGSLLTILGLIGTTIVPYNLFLHASLAKEKWSKSTDLKKVKRDTGVFIIVGGMVSMMIVIAASSTNLNNISSGGDLAKSLTPLFGSWSGYFLGIGLFAAGITSTITAPLAAAFVVKGCLGWRDNLKSAKMRGVWFSILLIGVIFSSIGIKPIKIIEFAQVANGILLPVIAVVLLWLVNKKTVLGNYTNSGFQNFLGLLIALLTVFLGGKGILKVFELL